MSAKTMAEKLLIKPGTTLWSSHPDRLHLVEPLPGRMRMVEQLSGDHRLWQAATGEKPR